MEVSEQHTAQFTHKWEAVASRGIRTILPRWAVEFRELAHGIWQNFPRKTVGPTNNYITHSAHTPRHANERNYAQKHSASNEQNIQQTQLLTKLRVRRSQN